MFHRVVDAGFLLQYFYISDLRVPLVTSYYGPGPMFLLATRSLHLKISFLYTTTTIKMMTLNAYFGMVYLLKTMWGE